MLKFEFFLYKKFFENFLRSLIIVLFHFRDKIFNLKCVIIFKISENFLVKKIKQKKKIVFIRYTLLLWSMLPEPPLKQQDFQKVKIKNIFLYFPRPPYSSHQHNPKQKILRKFLNKMKMSVPRL